jgi:hypothetical protein
VEGAFNQLACSAIVFSAIRSISPCDEKASAWRT